VYEGFAIPQAIRRIDIAGRDVTEHLQLLLRKAGATFHTSAEKEIVRTIKEKMCYVAEDPRKEEKEWGGVPGSGSASLLNKGQEYKLPDGRSIRVNLSTRFIFGGWGVDVVAWSGTISSDGDIVSS
jgi:centractin